jgi:hypothetical protein
MINDAKKIPQKIVKKIKWNAEFFGNVTQYFWNNKLTSKSLKWRSKKKLKIVHNQLTERKKKMDRKLKIWQQCVLIIYV